MHIDLNCDLGEASDEARWKIEAAVMPYVTSVNIACGFHAGSPDSMRRTIRLARAHGLAIGAHPSHFDRAAFGRRPFDLSPAEIEAQVAYQIGALAALAALEGTRLAHVKPHGALYNQAAQDPALAEAIAKAVAAVDRTLILVGLAGSPLVAAGRAQGLRTAQEAFADRAYSRHGTLMPRDLPGAVIHDEQEVVGRALQLVRDGTLSTFDGETLHLRPDTLCLHGDTPGADRLARAVREGLEAGGVALVALAHV